jgi:hypothetical protein
VHRGGQAPTDCSQQQQRQGAFGGGIELATAAAFGSVERRGGGGGGGGDTSALAAAPAGACEQPLTQQEPATSEASTPGWDAAGGGRARRPLLYDQSVRSSDRHPTESPPAGKGLPPLPAQAAGIMSGGGKAAGAAFEEQGAQQQSPPQQQGSATAEHPVRQLSLSFGRGSALAELGSLSLRGSGSQCMSDEADTAASKPSHSQTNGGGSGGALSAARLAALAAGDSGSLVSGGSTQALLALAQQPDSATADGSYGSLGLSGLRSAPGDASPTPPGAISRGNGSAAALLPLQQSPGAAVGDGSSPSTADTLPVRPRHAATSSVDVAAALGYDQAPPNAEEIYAAILSRNRVQRDGGDALAAVYCGSGEEAADGSGGGGGGEGIATRWWTSLQREMARWIGAATRVCHKHANCRLLKCRHTLSATHSACSRSSRSSAGCQPASLPSLSSPACSLLPCLQSLPSCRPRRCLRHACDVQPEPEHHLQGCRAAGAPSRWW